MKLLKTILVYILIPISDADISTRWPIGGLFNRYTLQSTKDVFMDKIKINSAYHGQYIDSKVVDSYSTALEVCHSTSSGKGIVALIDARPTNGICDDTCLLCNRHNITHLSLGWEPPSTMAESLFTFSYHPSPELISKAYAALIRDLKWDKFTILYEDNGSFTRLQEIINSWPYDNDPILYKKLDPNSDNRETFKYLFKVAHMSYHVLDCDVSNIRKYMHEIIQVDNSTQYQSFILTALEAYTVDLQDIPDLMANVSTLHITTANEFGQPVQLETALMTDAMIHLEEGIRIMQERPRRSPSPRELCFRSSKSVYMASAWPSGEELRQALLATTAKGYTGKIEFDEGGQRNNFKLYLSKLNNESQMIYAGYWDSTTDTITRDKITSDRSTGFNSKSTIRVASRIGEPYLSISNINGTATFVGYAVDLVDAIIKFISKKQGMQDLKYEFYRVSGDKHGNPIEGTKKWDGIVGDLMEHTADLGVCDMTITSERNDVVDFSTPFMTLGISILYREPDPEAPDMFSFIQPLSLSVWLYLCTAYIIVSLILLICARMSQGDWVNPHPCVQNPENLQNMWSLYNCMWLTMGAIMTQGCDILPRAGGSRWITGMWWFFALIITSSYTANMSTFLSNNRRSFSIKGVKDLAEQNDVMYGAMLNASTYKFFENANEPLYQKIWTVMKSARPSVFTNNNEEGRDRVFRSKGKYAFFMESTAIEYYKNKNCKLQMVGSKLDSKEYGIAMPKNSPNRALVDNAILALQESGELGALKRKWWEGEGADKSCEESESGEDDSGSLQMKNTSGIFLMLAVGGVLGFIVAIIDFLLHAHGICVREKVTFREAVISEWRASLNPRTTHKPAAPPRSAAPSMESSPRRERSQSRAVSVLRAASSFINFDEIY